MDKCLPENYFLLQKSKSTERVLRMLILPTGYLIHNPGKQIVANLAYNPRGPNHDKPGILPILPQGVYSNTHHNK